MTAQNDSAAQPGSSSSGKMLTGFGIAGAVILLIGIFIGGAALIFTSIEGGLLVLGSITAFFMIRSAKRAKGRKRQQSQQAPQAVASGQMARPSPQAIRPEPIRRHRPREIRRPRSKNEQNGKQDQHGEGCTCGIDQKGLRL